MTTFDRLKSRIDVAGAAFVVLLDPENLSETALRARVQASERAGVDAFFVGGSLVQTADTDALVRSLKSMTDLPVVGFPGSVNQISAAMDAVLYLSVVSGRNPDYLFGRHVYVAPHIRRLGVEAIPTAYLLIESGPLTTAQYMSQSMPIPRSKPDVAAVTALAAEMMGMQLLYMDAGSGAEQAVSADMIRAVRDCCDSPIVVGGGIRTPAAVAERVSAGADFIVVGNAFEEDADPGFMSEMCAAAHVEESRPLP